MYVHVYILSYMLHSLVQCVRTEVLPKAGLLEASKGSSHVCLVVSVNKHCASLQVVTHIQSLGRGGVELFQSNEAHRDV